MADNIPELRVDEHVPGLPGLALLPCPGDVAEGDLCGEDQAGQPEHQQRGHSHLQTGQSSDNDWPEPLVSDNIYTVFSSLSSLQETKRKENMLLSPLSSVIGKFKKLTKSVL